MAGGEQDVEDQIALATSAITRKTAGTRFSYCVVHGRDAVTLRQYRILYRTWDRAHA